MEGDTSDSRTRIAEKAITDAPRMPARTGRSDTRSETTRGYRARPVDRNTLLWTLVVFFGASIMFAAIANVTSDESAGVRLAIQVGAGALLVGLVVLVFRRRQ